MPISYSEYQSFIDTLAKSDEQTYEELMSKEKEVLNTVNNVVNTIKSRDSNASQFENMSVSYVAQKLFIIWPEILKDLMLAKTPDQFWLALSKEDRIIYVGISLIILALFIFLIESSSK